MSGGCVLSQTEQIRKQTKSLALCGVLAAVGTVVMMLGGMIPLATFCCPVIASLVLLPALDECGRGMSVGLYAVIGILSLLIAPDKEAAFLFVFIGYYPILKPMIESRRNKVLRVVLKLTVFNLALALLYGLLFSVIGLSDVMEEYETASRAMIVLLLFFGNVTFLLFDKVLAHLTILYRKRLAPQVKKLFRS